MFKSIYELFNYFISTYIKDVKMITLYSNQYRNLDKSNPLPTPTVLIEILPISSKPFINGVEELTFQVRLHILSEIYSSFNNNDEQKDKSFKHLELVDTISKGIFNINSFDLPEDLVNNDVLNINSIKRNSINLSSEYGLLQRSIITYDCLIMDKNNFKPNDYVELTEESDIVTPTTIN